MTDIKKFKTALNGRILCGDGDSIVELPFLYEHVLNNKHASSVYVSKKDYKSDEIQTYNKKFINDKVTYKTKINDVSTEWDYPKRYKTLDIVGYIGEKLREECDKKDHTEKQYNKRLKRTADELRLWQERELEDMLRGLIYIVDTLQEHKVVWGTGRGSSCSSYLLYLIGLHQVDCVKYNISVDEFFR